jgi:DNA polymerase III alpha subunit
MRYNNYHKHSHYSNIRSLDCVSKPEDYIKRAVELGHTTYFTTEHGYQGNIYEAYTLCQQYGLKCVYGVEAYYVDDMHDKTSRTNYHIILIAMTEKARKEINRIMSLANQNGFYYKPRIDLNCLLSLTPTDTIVTTACVAGRMFKSKTKKKKRLIGYEKKSICLGMDGNEDCVYKELNEDDLDKPIYEETEYEDKSSWLNDFLIPVYNHFKNNFYLEVQDHVEPTQANYNKMLLEVSRKYNIPIIHANDSHYIKPEDAKYRDLFLRAKGIIYEEESNFVLDYPDADIIIERYKKQGVLNDDEIRQALNNTLVFDNAEGITLDKEFKIPKITEGDSNAVLRSIIRDAWRKEKPNIPKERIKEYEEAIYYETKIISDCGMADYFILDHEIIKKAVNEYNAVLTRSGRGSAVSFYVNHLLGLTEIDRLKSPITLYPTRFMSAERILSSRSLPDIDLNFADVEPVIKASKDILGEEGIYYMVAYKPLQESSAFRLWCKANGYHIDEYDEIAKELDNHLENKKWQNVIEDSKVFRGVIESIAPSPCSFLLLDKPIPDEVGLIRVGNMNNYVMCCSLDGYNCDQYKYLKNDYLTVKVYEIIDKVYKLIGRPIDNIDTLISNCDDKVWDIYANALTTTINQSDSDFGKQTLKRYKPTSLAEMSAWVAAIRPGFASLLNTFLDRMPYSTGVEELDKILEDSFHFMMYQESIMKYLVWLGIEEKGTYDIIKKIAKKKFKQAELEELQKQLELGWIKNVGVMDGFAETWQVVQDAAHYSFNASHSLSVAIDSIYGAYLKSHYPLEYFTIVFNLYADDMDRTSKLIAELPYFKINLNPIKYGKSGADYTMDKESNSIYQGIASVKFCNSQIANELLELSHNHYNTFVDLLRDIDSKTSVNSRQLEILVKLNFFEEFGKNKTLLNIVDIYNKFANVKIIAKKKMEELGVTEFLMTKYAKKETQSQYRDIDNIGLVTELCSRLNNESLRVTEQMQSELEYLGCVNYVNKNMANYYYAIVSFETYKDACKPVVTLRRICDGEEIKARVKQSRIYKDNPFGLCSILRIDDLNYDFKRKLVDNEWVKSEETECVLIEYEVIKE